MSEETDAILINGYESATRKLRRARLCLSLAVLTAIVTFAYAGWRAVKSFADVGAAKVSELVLHDVSRDSPRYGKELKASAELLLPIYEKTFREQFQKDAPLLRKSFERELKLLEAHATNQWPEFERELKLTVEAQNTAVVSAFERVVGREQAKTIANNYAEAISVMLHDLGENELRRHVAAGQSIGHNLQLVLESEPDLPKPIDAHEAVGLVLELAGLELQKLRAE